MGAFPGSGGTTTLVRNHEVNNPVGAFGPGTPYDAAAGGGTTTIRTTATGEVLSAFTSLNGTMMNCSGGEMPWGSWITCEETVNGPDVGPDFTGASNTTLEKPHGYVFEVPAGGQSNREPITQAGRFAHEAVAFDPREGRLYLTEDNFGFASGYYRYTPKRNPMKTGSLDNEGVLEMLAVKNQPNAHLEGQQKPGRRYKVEWVRIDEPDFLYDYTPGETAPTPNDEAIVFVGDQGRAKGAAYFSRLEGQVYEDGVVYFTSTQAGGAQESGTKADDPVRGYGKGYGQVWAYDVRSETLTCVFQSPGPEVLDFPDNVTTSNSGTLVVCEDSSGDNYLRGLTRQGRIWDIALNRLKTPDGVPAVRRRVRRVDVQPRRQDALRQHPGQRRDDVRDLGPLEDHRGVGHRGLARGPPGPTGSGRAQHRERVGDGQACAGGSGTARPGGRRPSPARSSRRSARSCRAASSPAGGWWRRRRSPAPA